VEKGLQSEDPYFKNWARQLQTQIK